MSTTLEQLEQRLNDNDRFYQHRYEADQKALSAALTANDKRLDVMNEFRFALSDQAARLMPRAEATSLLEAMAERGALSREAMGNRLEAKINPLADKIDQMGKPNWTLFSSFAGVAVAIVAALWLIFGLKIESSTSPIALTVEGLRAGALALGAQTTERINNREGQVREINRQLADLTARTQVADQSLAAFRATQVVNSGRITAIEQAGAAQRADLRAAQAAQQQKLVEIETQFKSMSHVINLMKDDNHQMIGVLWSRAFPHVRLPAKNFRPNLYNDNLSVVPPQ